ncbi:hypothetical protein CMI37_34375 [Candidatus Pacearchaeota archaeon]|nr:hypothetical protein [Candidatus Pacearchaeota archaeon]
MIWFVIVGVVMLYGVWRFAPLSDDMYVSEETRMYYATGRQARRCAFVDWSSIEHLDAWTDSERKGA